MDDGTLRHAGTCRPVAGGRYAPAVPILRQDDPRIGCLALPISIVAGFIVGALVAAAFGVSAGWSSTIGLIVGGIGAVVAAVVLRREN